MWARWRRRWPQCGAKAELALWQKDSSARWVWAAPRGPGFPLLPSRCHLKSSVSFDLDPPPLMTVFHRLQRSAPGLHFVPLPLSPVRSAGPRAPPGW